mgnify:CR=1 FL=1
MQYRDKSSIVLSKPSVGIGDYKYGALKNTATELDSQSDVLIEALKYELAKRNLIVIGYSGRDKSLMKALKEAYSQPGALLSHKDHQNWSSRRF